MKKIDTLIGIGGIYQSFLFLIKIIKLYFIGVFLNSEELGIFAIIAIYAFLLESISKTGVADYLIAKKLNETDDSQWNNAWTLEFFKYIILFIITYLTSNYFSLFFELNDNGYYVKIFGFIFLINSLKNIHVTKLQKNLKLKKYFIYNLTPILLGLIVTIFLFYNGYTIEALIFGIVIQSLGHVILSYFFTRKIPRIYFNFSTTLEQLNFGKWIFLQTWVDFLNEKADRIILAKLLSIKNLGEYTFASSFTTDLQFQARNIFRSILFPYFSLNIDSKPTLQRNFLFIQKLIILFLIIAYTFTLLFYNDVINFFFGDKWNGTLVFIIPLLINSFVGILFISVEPIFLALQRPKVFFVNTLIKVVLLVPLLFSLTYYFGVKGVIVSLYIISCWQLFLLIFIIVKFELIEKPLIFRDFINPLIILCILGIVEYFAYHNFIIQSELYYVTYIILGVNVLISLYLLNKIKHETKQQ